MDRMQFANGHKYDLADGTSLGNIVIVDANFATLHDGIMDGYNFDTVTFLVYDPETGQKSVSGIYIDMILTDLLLTI